MNIQLAICAALALASATYSAPARSQTVFRCGNLYSQAPCPGAVTIDASDTRTAEQKAQTDATARQAAASALKMQQERIALERAAASAAATKHVPASSAHRQPKADRKDPPGANTPKKKGRAAPDYFTAAATPEDKKSDNRHRNPTPQATPSRADPPPKP